MRLFKPSRPVILACTVGMIPFLFSIACDRTEKSPIAPAEQAHEATAEPEPILLLGRREGGRGCRTDLPPWRIHFGGDSDRRGFHSLVRRVDARVTSGEALDTVRVITVYAVAILGSRELTVVVEVFDQRLAGDEVGPPDLAVGKVEFGPDVGNDSCAGNGERFSR